MRGLVDEGIEELARGDHALAEILSSIVAPRLGRQASLTGSTDRLYRRLHAEDEDSAHGRYNALLRRALRLTCGDAWRPLDRDRTWTFLRALGCAHTAPTKVYLIGGASAVLLGSRATAMGVDLLLAPEREESLRAIARLKDELAVHVELASPARFIPALPGWEERSLFVTRERALDVFHHDPYSQALAKAERGFPRDDDDVRALVARGLVDPARARALFREIEPQLYRYPAIDPTRFRTRVEALFGPLAP